MELGLNGRRALVSGSTQGIGQGVVQAHLDHPPDLDELAARANMSKRTLTRQFRNETAMAPIQWLNQQRLNQARELLESTDLPIDQVAEQAGFGTGGSLRLHLHEALGYPRPPTARHSVDRARPRRTHNPIRRRPGGRGSS